MNFWKESIVGVLLPILGCGLVFIGLMVGGNLLIDSWTAPKCPDCKTQVEATATYCPECGFALADFCDECGEALSKEAKFCSNCGEKVID